jgi:two-component system, LytTR family, response regulator
MKNMVSSTNIDPLLYQQIPVKEDMLLLTTSRGLEIIDINSILRVEAISNYSKLFFVDGRSLVVAKLLSWFEKKLAGNHFIRLHRGNLVNIRYIRTFDNIGSGEVVLLNNDRFPVSRRRRPELKKAIYHYYEEKPK